MLEGVTNGKFDLLVHSGGQVNCAEAFKEAWSIANIYAEAHLQETAKRAKERAGKAGKTGKTGKGGKGPKRAEPSAASSNDGLKRILMEKFRDVYRQYWYVLPSRGRRKRGIARDCSQLTEKCNLPAPLRNIPQRRAILANCSNLMIWSDLDVLQHFTSAAGAGGASVNELALRCAREVYREYQRQLWHPECVTEGVQQAKAGRDFKRNGLSLREQKWVNELLPGDEVEIVKIGSVESIKGPGKSAEHHSHSFLQGTPESLPPNSLAPSLFPCSSVLYGKTK